MPSLLPIYALVALTFARSQGTIQLYNIIEEDGQEVRHSTRCYEPVEGKNLRLVIKIYLNYLS